MIRPQSRLSGLGRPTAVLNDESLLWYYLRPCKHIVINPIEFSYVQQKKIFYISGIFRKQMI